MARDQVPVGKIKGRRTYNAFDHRSGVAEVILIVGALRCAVRQHQSRLPATPRPSAALRVIGGCRRNIAHIDGVKRRDINAELHRGRAKERGQEPWWLGIVRLFFCMLRQHPAIVVAKPKPAFAVLTTNAIDLCGVLSSLKAEDGSSP